VRKVVLFLLGLLNISTDELIIHFVTESRISLMHSNYFNDPSSTDCITFPIDAPSSEKTAYHVLGEAFICPKTALIYAERLGVSPYEELYRYLVHCLLHLVGYEDTVPHLRAKMKRKENHCLRQIIEAGLGKHKTL
jgi:probable rRNA maturation factor